MTMARAHLVDVSVTRWYKESLQKDTQRNVDTARGFG